MFDERSSKSRLAEFFSLLRQIQSLPKTEIHGRACVSMWAEGRPNRPFCADTLAERVEMMWFHYEVATFHESGEREFYADWCDPDLVLLPEEKKAVAAILNTTVEDIHAKLYESFSKGWCVNGEDWIAVPVLPSAEHTKNLWFSRVEIRDSAETVVDRQIRVTARHLPGLVQAVSYTA